MRCLVFFMLLISNYSIMNAQTKSRIIDYKELGLSFKIPSGWASQIDGDYMFLKHNTIPGLMVVFESRSISVQDMIRNANNGIHEDNVDLQIMDDFKATGKNTVEGHYKGFFMGSMVKAYALGKIDGLGSGMSVLAISEPKDFNDTLKNEAQKIMASVNFSKAEDSQQTRFWKKRLVGNRLKYRDTRTDTDFRGGVSSGISDKETLDLFNDGSFYYDTNNGSIVNSTSLRTQDRTSGEYRIVTLGDSTYLQLFFSGDSLEFELTLNARSNTLLNGRRYLLDSIDD